MIKITPHIYRIGGVWGAGVFSTNIYLLLDNGVTIVDTGYKGRVAQVCREIKRLGYTTSDVENIIVTHHHVDHTASLAALKKITGARIIAHSDDVSYIEGTSSQPCPAALAHVEFLESLWTARTVNVDVKVSDGDVLPLLGGIRIIHTPGHTPGSICLLIPQEGVLIAGDVIANTLGLRLPSKAFTADLAQEICSIRKIAGLDFNIICFGHGPPINNHARDAVADFTGKLKEI
jgi:glyoxylase-like metal-dependent hydrolase (beta-lactamase superfamily II)